MSPRRSPRRVDPANPPDPYGDLDRLEEHPDGEWRVRPIPGAAATKVYRCPGCDHEIRPGTPHVVVWSDRDADDRRHWHRPCWGSRGRRGVKVLRAKNAPHYG